MAKAITYMQHDYVSSFRIKHLIWALEQFANDVRQQQTLPPYIQADGEDEAEEEQEAEWTPGTATTTSSINNDAEKGSVDLEAMDDNDDEDEMQEIIKEEEEEEEAANSDEDEVPYALDCSDVSTPNFDELFPPVDESAQCVPMSVLAKTWTETGILHHKSDHDVRREDSEAFYTKLNGALNAYVATMLLEPRKLDDAFAKVDG